MLSRRNQMQKTEYDWIYEMPKRLIYTEKRQNNCGLEIGEEIKCKLS